LEAPTSFVFQLQLEGSSDPLFSGYNLRESPTPQFSCYNQKEVITPYVLRIQLEDGYNVAYQVGEALMHNIMSIILC